MKKWNELSMAEKVPYLKMGVDSGIYDASIIADRYNRFEDGGYKDTTLGLTPDQWKEIGVSLIPIYGSYKEVKNFIDNPSLENAGYAGLSLLSEIPVAKLAKLGKVVKIAKTAKKAPVITRSISKGLKGGGINKDLVYHLDRGNKAGAFSNRGAYVKKGTLYPGKSKSTKQLDYTWFNEGKPYSTSVNGTPLDRAIILDKTDVPDLIRVRDSKIPIGQWSGNSGLVLKSEMVTPSPVPLNNAFIYKRKQLPLVGEFWLRTN